MERKLSRDMSSDPSGSETFQVDVERRKPHIPCRGKAHAQPLSPLLVICNPKHQCLNLFLFFLPPNISCSIFSRMSLPQLLLFDPAGNRPIRQTWRLYFCLNLSNKMIVLMRFILTSIDIRDGNKLECKYGTTESWVEQTLICFIDF